MEAQPDQEELNFPGGWRGVKHESILCPDKEQPMVTRTMFLQKAKFTLPGLP